MSDWKFRFFGKFVFSDGLIAEQKPDKILKFIAKERRQILDEAIEALPKIRQDGSSKLTSDMIAGYNNAINDIYRKLEQLKEKQG